MNGRLGDFVLAILYDHGTDPQKTRVAAILGYLAPEHTRIGKATKSIDVFAFGAFLFKVACKRRPIEPRAPTEDIMTLVDRVFDFCRGEILEANDPKLGIDYVAEELELVLKLGLLCSHPEPAVRSSMRQVVHYLAKDVRLPELSALEFLDSGLKSAHGKYFDDFVITDPSSLRLTASTSVTDSILSGGS